MWQVSGLPGDLELQALSLVEGGLGASLRMCVPQDMELSLVGNGAEARVVEDRPIGVSVSTPIVARFASQRSHDGCRGGCCGTNCRARGT